MFGSGSGRGRPGSAQAAKLFQKGAATLLKCFAKGRKPSEQLKESSRKFYITRTLKRQKALDASERFRISASLKVPLQIAICDNWLSTCRTSEKTSRQCKFACAHVDRHFGRRIQNIPNISHLASVKWHMHLKVDRKLFL
jgi:hypothetical protein